MRKLLLLLIAAASLQATVVTGKITDLAGVIQSSNRSVTFALQNCGNNLPKVVGSAVIVPATKTIVPNAAGILSGTIVGNDLISCGTVLGQTYYQVTVFNGTQQVYQKLYSVLGPIWNIVTAVPLTNDPTAFLDIGAGYRLGDILYGSGSNTIGVLRGNTSTQKMVLVQGGDGTHSGMPNWQLITADMLSTAITSQLAASIAAGFTLTGLNSNITWATDGSHDIGASASGRPRDLWLSRNAYVAGNAGIGVSNPSAALEVAAGPNNSSIRAGGLEMQSYGVNDSWYAENIYYDASATIPGWYYRSSGYGSALHQTAGGFDFKLFPSGTAGSQATSFLHGFTVLNNGNVGIGTSNPEVALDVATASNNVAKFTGTGSGNNAELHIDAHGPSIGYAQMDFDDRGTPLWSIYKDNLNQFNLAHVGVNPVLTVPAAGDVLSLMPLGGGVGIGTSSPGVKLGVNGSAGLPLTSGASQTYGLLRLQGGTGVIDSGVRTNGTGWIQSADATNLGINYPLLLQPNGGNLGVGTTAPQSKLEIDGSAVVPGSLASETELTITRPGAPAVSWPFAASLALGRWAAGTTNPNSRLDINLKSNGDNNYFGDTTVMSLLSNGSVGIGTTSPTGGKLVVAPSVAGTGLLVDSGTNAVSIDNIFRSYGDNDTRSRVIVRDTSGGSDYDLRLVQPGVNTPAMATNSINGAAGIYTQLTNPLQFGVGNAAYMTMLSGGNVGIGAGATNPAASLHVKSGAAEVLRLESTGSDVTVAGGALITSYYDNTGNRRAYLGFGGAAKNFTFNTDITGGLFEFQGGGVGIGVSPSYQLHLSTDSAGKPTTSTWTITSDSRVKTNIRPFTDGLDVVNQLKPVAYELNGKAGLPAGSTGIGLIAQDALPVAPYMIGTYKAKLNPDDTEDTDIYNLNASAMPWLLVNAMHDLEKQTVQPVFAEDIQPACTETTRGQTRFVKDDTLGDAVQMCGRGANGAYAWKVTLQF